LAGSITPSNCAEDSRRKAGDFVLLRPDEGQVMTTQLFLNATDICFAVAISARSR
jgi:hypothetical protein